MTPMLKMQTLQITSQNSDPQAVFHAAQFQGALRPSYEKFHSHADRMSADDACLVFQVRESFYCRVYYLAA